MRVLGAYNSFYNNDLRSIAMEVELRQFVGRTSGEDYAGQAKAGSPTPARVSSSFPAQRRLDNSHDLGLSMHCQEGPR